MQATDCSIHLRNKAMFYFSTINNKKILKSDLLKNAEHFFTTRESVITPRDLPELSGICNVNLNDIANHLNIAADSIISPIQTHSSNIAIAKKGCKYPDTDALVVKDFDIAVALNFADCTPVIIYDAYNNIGAVAHAGWRGTAASIVPLTIEFMQKHFNTDSKAVTAIIGPAISLNNYQVDEEVYLKLKSTLHKEYEGWYEYDSANNKYNVDLKTINQYQLRELGVKRIDKCEYCTYDSVDVFFSYRKEYGKTARHSAVLKLSEKNS